ncbi:PIN domain-containing protein [Mucilaginibacter flavidus]|uniref:PIN domain-containing protein n=1 Tax=Mucilaginibacter flavidus TaxID=2949309 RepID=UPI002093CCB8|nr:PIN domain-containing protein [Mucilaginibacter flavidus]MCO5945336.1 PIN domain-containing protein [Mucilaginibacter flavidus]
MKVLFIDSDVLLDTILIRQQHFNESVAVMELADNSEYTFCTSTHSLLNIHYVVKKTFGEKLARRSILMLVKKLKIMREDVNIIEQALYSDFSDFEDAVQFYAAKSADANFIITRNIKDYKHSTIAVVTPEQFLRTL